MTKHLRLSGKTIMEIVERQIALSGHSWEKIPSFDPRVITPMSGA